MRSRVKFALTAYFLAVLPLIKFFESAERDTYLQLFLRITSLKPKNSIKSRLRIIDGKRPCLVAQTETLAF